MPRISVPTSSVGLGIPHGHEWRIAFKFFLKEISQFGNFSSLSSFTWLKAVASVSAVFRSPSKGTNREKFGKLDLEKAHVFGLVAAIGLFGIRTTFLPCNSAVLGIPPCQTYSGLFD